MSRAKNWSDAECAVLLQSVLTGNAQQAYSSLSEQDSVNYKKMKFAMLKLFKLL